MKTIPWGMATCLFHKFSCLKSKFVPLKTQKSEKKLRLFDFFGLQLFTFHFFLHFFNHCLELIECFFWEVGTFFSKVFMSLVKISYRTKHKKNMKNVQFFDVFGLQLFTIHFFLHFLIQCLELMKFFSES